MESTLDQPRDAAEIAESHGAYKCVKRPQGVMKGIGFIASIWLTQALESGLFPTTRSYTLASIIAKACDSDGRFCFCYLETLVDRCGGTMSASTIKRAIKDLIKMGLLRKLNRRQTRAFFWEDLSAGRRWADRLPCVLEVLIPASAFTEQNLAEINEVRARLGEEPLNAITRPYPSVGTTGHVGFDDGSGCACNRCPGYCFENEDPGPFRDSETTGEQKPRIRPDGPFGLIARISEKFLSDPETDRERLCMAVENLLRQGLSVHEACSLLAESEKLHRPFPALMQRLHSLANARAFLDGKLGQGVHRPWSAKVEWPGPAQQDEEDSDPFDQSPRFVVDAQGKADKTCPEHPGVRNHPGGRCDLCQGPCRDVPGEIVHPPASAPVSGDSGEGQRALSGLIPSPRSGQDPSPPPVDPLQESLDPELLERMGASMERGTRAPGQGSMPREGHDVARAGASLARMQLAQALGLDPGDLPGAPAPTRAGAPGALTSAGAPGGG